MTTVPSSATVVWWRESVHQFQIPRVHRIGWVDTTGRPHGEVSIANGHLRLDRRSIETALEADLIPHHYERRPLMRPAGLVEDDQLDVEASLRISGHRIVEADLVDAFGLEVVAGVSAQLLAGGPRACIVLDLTLDPPVRRAALVAADQALHDFAAAKPSQLHARGWARPSEDRWQLLLRQR